MISSSVRNNRSYPRRKGGKDRRYGQARLGFHNGRPQGGDDNRGHISMVSPDALVIDSLRRKMAAGTLTVHDRFIVGRFSQSGIIV